MWTGLKEAFGHPLVNVKLYAQEIERILSYLSCPSLGFVEFEDFCEASNWASKGPLGPEETACLRAFCFRVSLCRAWLMLSLLRVGCSGGGGTVCCVCVCVSLVCVW